MSEERVFVLILVGVCLAAVLAVVGATIFDGRRCESRGGHMHSLGRDSLCLSRDGRVIE